MRKSKTFLDLQLANLILFTRFWLQNIKTLELTPSRHRFNTEKKYLPSKRCYYLTWYGNGYTLFEYTGSYPITEF